MAPLISVILPMYNASFFLQEAVNSILDQTFVDFELIILNDGSTDDSKSIIKSLSDSRIKFIDFDKNRGNYIRRNQGCKIANGKYICVMDADDKAHKDRLRIQVEIMEKDNSLVAAGTFFNTFGKDDIYIKPILYDQLKIALLKNNYFLHPSLIIRKQSLIEVEYYNVQYVYASDYDLMCKLIKIGKVINIPEVLITYRWHNRQISSRYRLKQMIYAQAIRTNYLLSYGFTINSQQMTLFRRIMNDEPIFCKDIVDINLLINTIKMQNKQIGCFNYDLLDSFFIEIQQNILKKIK